MRDTRCGCVGVCVQACVCVPEDRQECLNQMYIKVTVADMLQVNQGQASQSTKLHVFSTFQTDLKTYFLIIKVNDWIVAI